MTCTIDARWAPGEIVSNGPLVPVLDRAHLRSPSSGYEAAGFLPKDDGSWNLTTIDLEWLHILAPVIELNGKNRSTLTTLFEVIGLINGTYRIRNAEDLDRVYSTAASAIATLIVDGMSRIGVDSQVGNPVIETSRIDRSNYKSFFSGNPKNPSYTYPPPPGVSAKNQTKLTWYVTIPGLSYKADSTAANLSLALLFTYTLMVLLHMGWTLATGYSSKAWKSPEELIVLAKNSPPQAGQGSLANTCSSIEDRNTWKKMARIRAIQSPKLQTHEEELHVLIDEGVKGYTKVERNREYGQR